jgi:diguanylate cyclase (GGDEF)-like protein
LFGRRAQECVDAAARNGGTVGLALVDLDRFKQVNDTLGHAAGDTLLCAVARRLQEATRDGDTVARLGGDEFGIILPNLPPDGAVAILERLRNAVALPLEIGGDLIAVEATFGVAISPGDGADVESLLQLADIAMYEGKRSQVRVVQYNPSLGRPDPARLAVTQELQGAAQRGELMLHLQPKVAVVDGHVIGAEALLRWQHPRLGLVPPDRFIPVAEETGLIKELTYWVLERALEELQALDAVAPGLHVAVNVSAKNLHELDFAQRVFEILRRAGVEPARLTLELTETALTTEADRALSTLQQLHDGGVRLSLDDFGQGYTSLGQISHLPLNELKIDKAFVTTMCTDSGNREIVRSVVGLAHSFGLRVVAEGVESADVLAALGDLGCDQAQGYHIARPAGRAEFVTWLAARDTSSTQSRVR